LFVAAILAVAVAGGCGRSEHSAESAPVAVVGGQPITRGLLDHYVKAHTGAEASSLDPTLEQHLLADLRRIVAAAVRADIKSNPELEEELALQRLLYLAKAAATKAGVYEVPGEADLLAEYERFRATLPASEYHVAHILVPTENAAMAVILRLQSGGDFAVVAYRSSADDSRSRGGDLGWIAPGKLPAAFTNAVRSLRPGSFTPRPVQTPYGWHVIKLLETRAAQVPPLEQVRAQLAVNLQEARYRKFLDDSLAATGEAR
jgi:peptidyl-prolyl cis-trans isomerase C